jgi:hypothetical protein
MLDENLPSELQRRGPLASGTDIASILVEAFK